MSKLVGVWDVSSSENWDEYLKEIGVGMVMRKTAGSVKPTVTLENSGDEWTMKVSSTLKSSELKFTVGVQFEESNFNSNFPSSRNFLILILLCLLRYHGRPQMFDHICQRGTKQAGSDPDRCQDWSCWIRDHQRSGWRRDGPDFGCRKSHLRSQIQANTIKFDFFWKMNPHRISSLVSC